MEQNNKPDDYVIVTFSSATQVETAVKHYIQEGYELRGGLVVTGSPYTVVYSQVVVKYNQ